MELYLLDSSFNTDVIIDEFESCIWTERYVEAGDFKLVLPVTAEYAEYLGPGDFLRSSVSSEVMLIDTQQVEAGMMTLSGKTLEVLLDNQALSPLLPTSSLTLTDTAGGIVTRLMQMVLNTIPAGAYMNNKVILGPQDNTLPNYSGSVVTEVVSPGPLYSQILAVAQKYNLGLKMTAQLRADASNKHDFYFSTYRGVDRTKNQSARDVVIFSTNMDNIQDIKEVRSVADLVTQMLVYPPKELRALYDTWPGSPVAWTVSRAGSFINEDEDRPNHNPASWLTRRRSIIASGVRQDQIGTPAGTSPTFGRLLRQAGFNELEKHRTTYVVDGELVVGGTLKYGKDFHLGDMVELTRVGKPPYYMTITEHIHSDDAGGRRAYTAIAPVEDNYGAEALISPDNLH